MNTRVNAINVGENIVSLSDAKAYMARVLDIVEWSLHTDTIRTYQRRFGGRVDEEGVVVEFDDEETGRTKSANVHYYLRGDDCVCLRFGRNEGYPDCTGSDMPFYGTAEDAADFLCGWIAEQWRKEEDDYFELTDEQKRDGYVPHELPASARKRLTEVVLEAARQYAAKRDRLESEMKYASKKDAAIAKKASCKVKKAV